MPPKRDFSGARLHGSDGGVVIPAQAGIQVMLRKEGPLKDAVVAVSESDATGLIETNYETLKGDASL
jgi:hypothetical protein